MTAILTSENLAALQANDRSDMLALLRSAPERGQRHLELARGQQLAPPADLRQVLVCGMGGSGSVGDLLQALCHRAQVPILVNKSPDLPAWVGPGTLLIAVSYSGNTFETLGCVKQALTKGARIFALASGGELAELARQQGFPCIAIEGGLPPRAALFEMLFALLGALEQVPELNLEPAQSDAALALLAELSGQWSPVAGAAEPRPLTLARELVQPDPILIWGVSGSTDVPALRWKNQLAENAKTSASVGVLPELNHNEVVGLCGGKCAGHHSRPRLIYLTLETEMPAADKVVLDLVAPHVQTILPLTASGGSRTQTLLYLVYLGDFFSVYLALLQGTDPTPIAAIDELKRRMG